MGVNNTLVKSKPLLIFIFLFFSMGLNAQNIEFGLYLGGSNYMGDVSEQKLRLDQTHFSAAFIGRYNVSPKVTIKGFAGFGKVSGADSLATNPSTKLRNTNFHSDIYEFSVHAEYNLIRNNMTNRGGRPLVPYIFAGIGIFHFNPKTEFMGNTYELQPLGTEGQGTTNYNNLKKYDLTTICIPMGIGLKKRVAKNFAVGIELGMRFTFTNYLDDVGGTYANAIVVERAYGTVAGSLANRTEEVIDQYPNLRVAREGDPRTTPAAIIPGDMYFIGGLSLSYIFQSNAQCPRF